MKKIKSIIILIFAVFIANTTLLAQLDRSIQPKEGPAPEFKISEHKTFTLENGLKVIVVENHKTPRISYQLTIDVDPIMEEEHIGFVEMTGDLLGSGTTSKTKSQIDESIDFIGASFFTYKKGIYGLTLTKNKTEFLQIMSDILLNPIFPAEEVEKSKKQSLSGLASSKTNPQFIANRVGQKLRNTNHPYSEISTEETIGKITRDHLVNYYKLYYKPNVSYLVIVGDITEKQARIDAEKYFGSWKKGDVKTQKYQYPNKNIGTRVALVDKEDAVQSYISITYPVNLKVGDKEAISATLANEILGNGTFSARLLTNLREDKGYTYGAYSNLSKDPLVGHFKAYAQVGTDVTDDAVNQFIIEMNRMKSELVSDETLQLFKNIYTGTFAQSLEDPQTIASFAYNSLKYNLPVNYYQTYLEKIASVTKEDVLEVSKKFIDPNQAIIVVVGDKKKILEPLKKYSSTGVVEIYDIYGNPVIENPELGLSADITAEKVIENYIEAIGGKDSLENVETIIQKANTSMNGMTISMVTYKKAPNKFTMEVFMNSNLLNKQSFDGEKGKMKGFQGEKEITGEELEELKIESIINQELKYQELGISLTLDGVEKINGEDAYKIAVIKPNNKKSYDFYSIETGLKILTRQTIVAPQGEFVQSQSYSDYREINGVKYPFIISASGIQNMELVIESIEVNTEIKDEVFQ
ncbi:MAG: hypothetical protein A2W99_17085 [Bacteroidetes bacterium GWF2_33_16]|nr:MAG: hypothetical protein A2X00_13710 [Bacteroidetes bacterium GWE2_32_14]OFY03462.1 MAG: hypothetical protein A2W99_17085 [Bacteroidetes bacterium GWF2_33_16]